MNTHEIMRPVPARPCPAAMRHPVRIELAATSRLELSDPDLYQRPNRALLWEIARESAEHFGSLDSVKKDIFW